MLEEVKKVLAGIRKDTEKVIRRMTENHIRCERYDVTTAPNGTVIGVTQPFGTEELLIPYSWMVSNAQVGDTVIVVWWNGLSNAQAWFMGEGWVSKLLSIRSDGNGININGSLHISGDVTGRVLGLGQAIEQIPSSANLNNYTTPGVYGILSSSVAATIVNNPSTRGASTLRVWNGRGDGRSISDDGGMIMQEISDAYGCSWRRRAQNSSGTVSWSPWNTEIILGQSSYQIGTGQDLNSFITPGVYAIAANSIAQTLVHSPTNVAGTLRVWNAVGDGATPGGTWYYVVQEYINLYGDTWRRSGQSGSGTTITWEAWSYYAGMISHTQTNLGLGTLQTYTPTFSWSDSSTITTSSVFGYYAQIGRVLFISARCRITNLGTSADKYLLMSLPSGYTTASTAIYSTIGNVVPPTGNTNQYLIRPAGASSSNLSIHSGGGADFPRSGMTTGYYAFMAIVPIE